MLVVGRATGDWRSAPDLDLSPLDPGQLVSRRHAQLHCGAGGVVVRDLGSTNGTAVDGRRLEPEEVVRLRSGDVISFGGVTARYEESTAWPEGLQAAWNLQRREEQTRPGPRA